MDPICLPPNCRPTWVGHIATTRDALIIFQACIDGELSHCARRPYNRERRDLIKSGNIFVYEEESSGIQRWTDGLPWSPSRVLTDFLIYRQLNDSLAPSEKRRATKRCPRSTRGAERYVTQTFSIHGPITSSRYTNGRSGHGNMADKVDSLDRDEDRDLVGSLVDSYDFKEHGLFKKTMTVSSNGVHYHMIAYYSVQDAKYNLETPSENSFFKHISISQALKEQSRFKYNEDEENTKKPSTRHQPTLPYRISSQKRCGELREDQRVDGQGIGPPLHAKTAVAYSDISDPSLTYLSSPTRTQDMACMSDSPISNSPPCEAVQHFRTDMAEQYVPEIPGQATTFPRYYDEAPPSSCCTPAQPFSEPLQFHQALDPGCLDTTMKYQSSDPDFSSLTYPWTWSPQGYSNIRTHVVGAASAHDMQSYWTGIDMNRPCQWQ